MGFEAYMAWEQTVRIVQEMTGLHWAYKASRPVRGAFEKNGAGERISAWVEN